MPGIKGLTPRKEITLGAPTPIVLLPTDGVQRHEITGDIASAAWKINLHCNSLLILKVILMDANSVAFSTV